MDLWVTVVLFLVCLQVYLIPVLVAAKREHRQIAAIAAVNVLLGWTLVGWVVALAWSLTTDTRLAREGR